MTDARVDRLLQELQTGTLTQESTQWLARGIRAWEAGRDLGEALGLDGADQGRRDELIKRRTGGGRPGGPDRSCRGPGGSRCGDAPMPCEPVQCVSILGRGRNGLSRKILNRTLCTLLVWNLYSMYGVGHPADSATVRSFLFCLKRTLNSHIQTAGVGQQRKTTTKEKTRSNDRASLL